MPLRQGFIDNFCIGTYNSLYNRAAYIQNQTLRRLPCGRMEIIMKKRHLIIGLAVLIVLCAAAFLLYRQFAPQTSGGEKKISVTVIHGDKTEKTFNYQTDAEYLGEVLTEENLVTGDNGDYGLFITEADGETADESRQQWWCITKGGETVNTSADQTPIHDNDQFEITLKEGY